MQEHNDIENLNAIISANLKRLRREKGLTLDTLAEMTGVSKSMLGQIERGESAPSVATLWKISTGMKISFTSLMVENKQEAQIIDNEDIIPLNNGDDSFKLYPVFPFEPGRNFEILTIEMEPGAESLSLPHDLGTEEFVMVYSGQMTLLVGDATYTLNANQSIRYQADKKHGYANKSAEKVKLCMVIYYA